MQIAGIELGARAPVLVAGATEWIPPDLAIGDNAAVGGPTHVVIRVRPHRDLVRVRLFDVRDDGGFPLAGVTVFAGALSLPQGRLVMADGLGDSRFVQYLGKPGQWQVTVAVDDAVGFARSVDLGVRLLWS